MISWLYANNGIRSVQVLENSRRRRRAHSSILTSHCGTLQPSESMRVNTHLHVFEPGPLAGEALTLSHPDHFQNALSFKEHWGCYVSFPLLSWLAYYNMYGLRLALCWCAVRILVLYYILQRLFLDYDLVYIYSPCPPQGQYSCRAYSRIFIHYMTFTAFGSWISFCMPNIYIIV